MLTGATASAQIEASRPRPLKLRRWNWLRGVLRDVTPAACAYFDLTIVAATVLAAHRLLVQPNPQFDWVAGPGVSMFAFCGGITVAGLIFGLYDRNTLYSRSRVLIRSAQALGAGLIFAYFILSMLLYLDTTRWLCLAIAVVYALVCVPVRCLLHQALAGLRLNTLLIGSGSSMQQVVRALADNPRGHYHMLGFIDIAASGRSRAAFDTYLPTLGPLADLEDLLQRHEIEEVIVDADLAGDEAVANAVLTCLDHRCRVSDPAVFLERHLGEVPVSDINASWFLLANVQAGGGYEAVKRVIDVVAATAGLVLTLPLWPLIAVAIRLDSRGPAIYRQQRVGRYGRMFTIYKFRTMQRDAEPGGARWATENDARVTRVGLFLRRTRLDELPQLWNILRGDMSLVGPRPERPEFVNELCHDIPHYSRRHLVQPGLTGWAQLHYGYGASVDDARRKLCYDLYYLKHRSLDVDVAIVIRTFGRFMFGAR